MYLRAKHALATRGHTNGQPSPALPANVAASASRIKKVWAAVKRGLYPQDQDGHETMSVVTVWPVPEVMLTLFYASGLLSTSVKTLSLGALANGCCVPYACWLPILVLLYVACFFARITYVLYKFARHQAPLVAVPASEIRQVGGPFRLGPQAGRAEPERTYRISLDPFRFGAIKPADKLAKGPTASSVGLNGRRDRVHPQADAPQIADTASQELPTLPTPPTPPSTGPIEVPPSPPPSPPSDGVTESAGALQSAQDAAYALHYIWLGDARKGREGYALLTILHTLSALVEYSERSSLSVCGTPLVSRPASPPMSRARLCSMMVCAACAQ